MPFNIWKHRVQLADIFYNHDLSFEEKRDKITYRLKTSGWFKGKDESSDLHMLVEELGSSDDVDDFDFVWDRIYDEADYDRCWIAIH